MIRELVATIDRGRASRTALASPSPGVFRPAVRAHAWLAGGDVVGTLEVLGRRVALVVPRGIAGEVELDPTTRAVGYGDTLALVDAAARTAAAAANAFVPNPIEIAGLIFRAPTSGRYYGRPTPEKPPFVTVGAELVPGATVCLLEVMKTFNRVTYGGAPARVREVLVADGADVNADQPLLALDPG